MAGDKEGGPSPHGVHVPTREWTQNPSNLAVAARARGIKLLRRSLPRTYALVGGGAGRWPFPPKCVNRKLLSRGASQKIDNERSAH